MKTVNIASIMLVVLVTIIIYQVKQLTPHQIHPAERPGSPHKYYAGEVLYPDYAHGDTLIVIDPDGLNKYIVNMWSDGDINFVLSRHCVVKGWTMPEYGIDIDDSGYHVTDYPYGNITSVPWGTDFDSLMLSLNQ